ncbi:MAG TPA: NAD-dependent succinate-semialdehyde dehydrogenase [Bacteroides sp.]|nr:NAD-dependent succinate-semialdehyde dehydrogenase [Bacteroides sp.]
MPVLQSVNPYDPSRVVNYPQLSGEQLTRLLERARPVFQTYRKHSMVQRKEGMDRVAVLLREHNRHFAEIITREMGKPIGESVAEVDKCAWVCEFYAEHAAEFLKARKVKTDAKESLVQFQPLGPILAVMPWNFPFWQVFRFAAPTLMAGNTVLLKHASGVQGCAQAIQKIFTDAGFGEGVFRNMAIGSDRVAQVIEHPSVAAVTLTGSGAAGRSVAEISGRHLKKCVLELGGSNAFVVLNDASLEKALDVAIPARLQNGGQSCIAAKRFILESGVAKDFIARLSVRLEHLKVGDPMREDTDMGPLSSVKQAQEVEKQVKRTVEMGAGLVRGGKRDGAFFGPTILTGVRPGMPAFDEEVFGPVFAVMEADSPQHALELSNRSPYGLGVQVFTRSDDSARLFMEDAEEGAVFINDMVRSDPRLPFGGVKQSGYGRELSVEGIREFVNVKTGWVGKS